MLCDLVAGGVSKQITAAHASRILEKLTPPGPVAAARRELAGQFLEDLRGLDAQLRDTGKKLAAAVRASGTSLTGVFGFGPAGTGTVIGDVTGVTRFPSRDHFASYNGSGGPRHRNPHQRKPDVTFDTNSKEDSFCLPVAVLRSYSVGTQIEPICVPPDMPIVTREHPGAWRNRRAVAGVQPT